MASDSVLNTKSYAFAIRIVKLSQLLQKEKSEVCSVKANITQWNLCWRVNQRVGIWTKQS